MRKKVFVHASTLATPVSTEGEPVVGEAMGHLRIIQDGAVAVENGRIFMVDTTKEVLASVDTTPENIVDLSGKTLLPGFVDAHTHMVFSGSREDEMVMRLQGWSYMDILKSGGGILNTVKATRETTEENLYQETKKRADRILSHGTTTAEAKSGYGLELEAEIKSLRVLSRLHREHPLDIVSTFLGAHAVPMEYKDSPGGYVEYVAETMLPRVAEEKLAIYCDVFCEKGVFTVDEARLILEKARRLGLGVRIHADEMEYIGGSMLGVEMDAASIDHMVATPDDVLELMASKKIPAVLLPGTPFVLMNHRYPRARHMIDMGVPVVVATDLNPNCYTESIQAVVPLSCFEMKMTPEEVITSITLNAAYSLGLSKDRGSLEEGKKADLVVLDTPNHRHLGYHWGVNLVDMVVKDGKIVYP